MEDNPPAPPQGHQDSFDKDEDAKETDAEDEPHQNENTPIVGKENQSEEEKAKREALTEELNKIEADMKTLRSVLNSKQNRANEIKKLLGFNIVNDVKERVKNLQDSEVLQKTNQAFRSAGERTSAAFSNFGKRFGDVKSKIGESIGTSINNVKARVSNGNRSEGAASQSRQPPKGSKVSQLTIADEDISLYADLDDTAY